MVQTAPEHNVTNVDFDERRHFRYRGPLIDIHAHLFLTNESDPLAGPPIGAGPVPGASLSAAETMLGTAASFGIVHTVTMCRADEIKVLRDRFGDRISVNAWIGKFRRDESDSEAYRTLDLFLERGARIIKLWSAPRGRNWGMTLDTPWRIECIRRARAAGVRNVMVHVADPDAMFKTTYADVSKFGTKSSQYAPLERLLEDFPEMCWIAAHMGGDPECPDHLQRLLETYPHLMLDTSATKWQVREVSAKVGAFRHLICRFPDRFLFGVDLVTRHHLPREHYVSRYWCQRTLWESAWQGASPIADADFQPTPGGDPTPMLHGLELPPDVLAKVYFENAAQLLGVSTQADLVLLHH